MSQRLSLFFFFLLFPGVFFYSSAVAAGLIPAVLGGGFGIVASIALVALLPLLFVDIIKLRGKSLLVTTLFFILVLYTLFWLLIHHFLGDTFQKRLDVFFQVATVIAAWLTLFSIGYFWPLNLSKGYISVLLICLGGITLIVFMNIDFRRLIFLFGLSDADGALSYQGLSRSAAVTGLVLLSVIRSIRLSFILAVLLLTTVFFIGARSELVGVVAVLPFIAYLHYRHRPLATVSAVLVVSMVVLSVAGYSYDKLSTSRQFQLLNISESSSGMARASMFNQAMETIKESPVLGDFAGQVRRHDSTGAYAHNALSAWRQFGVVGFVLYLSLSFISLALSIRLVRQRQNQEADLPRIAATLSLFTLILMLGAKSVFWVFPALAWGLTVACYRYKTIATPTKQPAEGNSRFIKSCIN